MEHQEVRYRFTVDNGLPGKHYQSWSGTAETDVKVKTTVAMRGFLEAIKPQLKGTTAATKLRLTSLTLL